MNCSYWYKIFEKVFYVFNIIWNFHNFNSSVTQRVINLFLFSDENKFAPPTHNHTHVLNISANIEHIVPTLSLMGNNIWRKLTMPARHSLMIYVIYWRSSLIEDGVWWKVNIWWKMNVDGRWPFMEKHLWWRKKIDGERKLMKDDFHFWWKMTIDLKMTFSEIRTSMEEDLWWQKTYW